MIPFLTLFASQCLGQWVADGGGGDDGVDAHEDGEGGEHP
jgi:hypothetical protein